MYRFIYIYICLCTYIYIYVYIYIYIYPQVALQAKPHILPRLRWQFNSQKKTASRYRSQTSILNKTNDLRIESKRASMPETKT